MDRQDNPRFEFRVFGNPLHQTLERILQTTPIERTEQQHDLYLLSAGEARYNVKIRDHKLNTKILMRCQEGLERWHPHLDLTFPLSAAFLHEILLPLLQIPPMSLAEEAYSVEAFEAAIVQPNPAVRAVPVHKQRRHYQVGECQLEVAILYVDNRFYTHTVALEGVDVGPVQQLRAQLGLETAENVNYNRGLQELLACDWTETYTFSFAERAGFAPITA